MGGTSGHNLMLNVTTESFFFSLVWSATPLALRQQRDFILISHHGIAYEARGRRTHMWHTLQCSSSCLTHHCSFKILFVSVSSQGDVDSFLPQWSCSAAALGNQVCVPSQGPWGNLLFLLLLNEVPFATGAVKVLTALILRFSSELSFAEKLRDVRTQGAVCRKLSR